MSRRGGITWAPTSVPRIRGLWCDALDAVIAHHSTGLITRPGNGRTADGVRMRRLQDQLAHAIEVMKAETEALRDAELYWVARDMVDVAREAAPTLPEWTPAVAIPCRSGLLCWAKPAGTVPYGPSATATTDVPWDGVWWWTRPDGRIQLSPASRFVGHADLLAPYEVSTPLWAAHTIVVDAQSPRTAEVNGAEDMHPFVSMVGAAWLLMGQPGVTETRSIRDRPESPSTGNRPSMAATTTPAVTIVELRRPVRPARDDATLGSARSFSRRWWVGGHWRQQACGPQLGQRRPTWIAPYVKGPPGTPLTSDRVYVWRR